MKSQIRVIPTVIVLFWVVLFSLLGQMLDLLLPGIIVGLGVGGGLALLGEWIDNGVARSLTLLMILGAVVGAILSTLVAFSFSAQLATLFPDFENADPGGRLLFEFMASVLLIVISTGGGCLLGLVGGIVASLRIRRRQVAQFSAK